MKKLYIVLVLLLSLILTSCSNLTTRTNNNGSGGTTTLENSYAYSLPSDDAICETDDMVILHAYNWTFNNIKSQLKAIKDAGYTAVQTSPVQPPKDYNSSWTNRTGQWWKLYQPLGFHLPENTWLGTTEDLKNLCTEADKYHIRVIVDVVTNHLASKGNDTDHFNEGVEKYERELYSNQSAYIHQNTGSTTDSSRKSTVIGNIGMPDLNTSTSKVQERVIAFLKDLIDIGVDGFRFDAAKHIETPDDASEYKSDYWPNVTSAAYDYYKEKTGMDLYIYAEILNTPGNGGSFSAYTKYMDITDNITSDNTRKYVASSNVTSIVNQTYNTKQDPSQLVVWAESHDTFEDNSSSSVSSQNINKTWALVESRKDVTGLYLSRPGSTMGSTLDTEYLSTIVKEINNFHRIFNDYNEEIKSSGNIVYITKTNNTKNKGIVLVNLSTSNNVSITLDDSFDGRYIDKVTSKTFEVKNGVLTGTMSSDGVSVLYKEESNSTTTTTTQTQPTASITITFDPSACSWFLNDGYLPAISINNGEYVMMTKTGNYYTYSTDLTITSIKICRKNGNQIYNEATIPLLDSYNGYVFKASSTWSNSNPPGEWKTQ